jgi:hypothetical protein
LTHLRLLVAKALGGQCRNLSEPHDAALILINRFPDLIAEQPAAQLKWFVRQNARKQGAKPL